MFIAEDYIQFRYLFVNQLKNMLADNALGAFILVLANSQQDECLKAELQEGLNNTFIALKKNFSAGNVTAAQDDIEVFNKLQDIELDDISVWKCRMAGSWEIAFNAMRQLRPMRASAEKLNSIKLAFDENRFHFNKPFLKPEILWEGLYREIRLRVFYNKFPFSDYHLLVTVSPEKNSSQLLTQEAHNLIEFLVNSSEKNLPGLGIGFNSLAAGASVNHFHFQGFIRDHGFPVESERWSHNGGDVDYPLTVECFKDNDSSWRYIEQLISQDIAFNVLYRKNTCYVMPRKYQGAVELPEWLTGAGWLDAAGVITVSDEEVYKTIDAQSITDALTLLKQSIDD